MTRSSDHIDGRWDEPSGQGGEAAVGDEAVVVAVMPGTLSVTDNFPVRVPIRRAELEVIETYFGSLLDELLSG
jgi:hypothetical protein